MTSLLIFGGSRRQTNTGATSKMITAAIYARYSSDNQSEASIDDQAHNCRARIEAEGWTLAGTYTDSAISGATVLRPGYQMMLEEARQGSFSILVAEALDRLSRDQEDVAGLYKQLSFAGIKIITLSEGEISELHVGLKGTMNALFLKDLAQKTHRGLAGRARDGKSAGGKSYGYDVIRELDEQGEPIKGKRKINANEVSVIRRIFDQYLDGRSPRSIAIALNKEGVPGPSGKGWTASTIIGNRKRGTGILNNQLYIGQQVWNRLTYRRDPQTRKRVSQPNPPDQWIVSEVPDLRIITDDQWKQAQEQQEERSRDTRPASGTHPNWRHRRPRHLFSGLIKCASCGGGMSLVSRIYYGCAANRSKGTCDNRLTLRLDHLEAAVLGGIQESLLTPELTAEFVREYTKETNRLLAERSATQSHAYARLKALVTQISNIVEVVASGNSSPALLDRLEALEKEKQAISEQATEPPPDTVRFHPNIADHYGEMVADLRACLNQEDDRDHAATIIRSLIDEIRLHPIDGELRIELVGDIATLIGFAEANVTNKKRPGPNTDPGRTKWLVAGVGFELTTLKL
jgi:site-specific DNA recombinase